MIKFIHLICGTTFFGLIIASFFYITHSIKKADRSLIHYSLKTSYYNDAIIFFLAFTQLISATILVSDNHFTLATPWIFIAYHALGTVILLWLSILIIKFFYLSKATIPSFALKIFNWLNIITILIFIIIIHDAVTQSTWFDFLFRK